MQLNVNGEDITVYGYLLAILADTPAAGFMAGMKQSPGFARKGCCTCTINVQEMQIKLDIAMLEGRCPNLHRQRSNDLKTMPQRLKPHWSKVWGINGTSPLLKLPYFNISLSMPHDPMHVLLEDLTGYAMGLLLQVCLTDKIFSLEWLNTQLQAFSYSYIDRDNKPEKLNKKQVFKTVSIKQTAVSYIHVFPIQGPHTAPFRIPICPICPIQDPHSAPCRIPVQPHSGSPFKTLHI